LFVGIFEDTFGMNELIKKKLCWPDHVLMFEFLISLHCTKVGDLLLKTFLGVLHLIGTLHNALLTLWAILSGLKMRIKASSKMFRLW
jgi:hypothetical protein